MEELKDPIQYFFLLIYLNLVEKQLYVQIFLLFKLIMVINLKIIIINRYFYSLISFFIDSFLSTRTFLRLIYLRRY